MKSISRRIQFFFLILTFLSSCQPWDLEKLDITCPKIINLTGSLNFGSVEIGTNPKPTVNLRITNSGTCSLNVFTIDVPVGFSHNFTSNSKIGSNQFLDIVIEFNPSQVGSYNGVVSINSDATAGVSTIIISGTGIDPGVGGTGILSVSGDIEFGSAQINSTVHKTFILTNTGDASLTVNNIQSDLSAFTISGITTPFNLDKNESKQINVQMNTSVLGLYNGNISIYSSANNKSFKVSGEVIGNGILSVSGNANFDTVQINSVVNKILTLSNTGNASLTINTIQSGSSRFTISGVSTPITLAKNEAQPINVQMNTSTLGIYSGDITISTSANTKIINASGVVVDIGSGSGCPTTFVDSRDGQSYKAKMLAGKCWMTENLRYDSPDSGADTPLYDNASLLLTYGRYYPWALLMNGAPKSDSDPSGVQGVCPNGWHVPSRTEMQTILTYYGNDSYLAYSSLIEGGASGLNFKIGGRWAGDWTDINVGGFYWTTSEYTTGQITSVWLINNFSFKGEGNLTNRLSCRCVKD